MIVGCHACTHVQQAENDRQFCPRCRRAGHLSRLMTREQLERKLAGMRVEYKAVADRIKATIEKMGEGE